MLTNTQLQTPIHIKLYDYYNVINDFKNYKKCIVSMIFEVNNNFCNFYGVITF